MQTTRILCGLVMILLAPPSRRLLLAEPASPLGFDVKLDVVKQELHPDFCWFHPRVAAILLVLGGTATQASPPDIPVLPWQERSDWINVKTDSTAARC